MHNFFFYVQLCLQENIFGVVFGDFVYIEQDKGLDFIITHAVLNIKFHECTYILKLRVVSDVIFY